MCLLNIAVVGSNDTMISPNSRVIRDGVEGMKLATEVVPGDIIIISLDDCVPAYLRVIESDNIACQEAALTGELVPIDKSTGIIEVLVGEHHKYISLRYRKNMCFSATLVVQVSGQGIVVTTDNFTQLGTINRHVSQTEKKKTNVLDQIDQMSKNPCYHESSYYHRNILCCQVCT